MNRCLSCNHHYPMANIGQACPACGWQPAEVDGFVAYAPDLASQGGGFRPEYFASLARLEEGNFWFRARNALILSVLTCYRPDAASLLEIGCGTGYVLSGLAGKFASKKLYGSEIFIAGLPFAARRVPEASCMQMDARNIPFVNEFDVVGAFDVLEHIEEDETVLAQIFQALKPGGVLAITVPQHPWLWSTADEFACHVRRYTARDLLQKIEDAGFTILQSTSFVSTLLPALYLSRLINKNKSAGNYDPLGEFNLPVWLNRLLEKILLLEIFFIKRGISFPAGGSLLVVAKKRQNDSL